MSTMRGHRPLFAATAILVFSLTSTVSHAHNEQKRGDNGLHKGWYYQHEHHNGWWHKLWCPKKDKNNAPVTTPVTTPVSAPAVTVSVPEPGTMALIVTGLVAAVGLGRRRPKV